MATSMREPTPHNKLFPVPAILTERKLDPHNKREVTPLLPRLRIRHTRLTHSCILKDDEPPTPTKCPCGNQYTIKHILIECTKLTNIR